MNDVVQSWSGPNKPVDMVMAAHVLYYMSHPEEIVKQMLQWLRPGGLLIIMQVGENITSKIGIEMFIFLLFMIIITHIN